MTCMLQTRPCTGHHTLSNVAQHVRKHCLQSQAVLHILHCCMPSAYSAKTCPAGGTWAEHMLPPALQGLHKESAPCLMHAITGPAAARHAQSAARRTGQGMKISRRGLLTRSSAQAGGRLTRVGPWHAGIPCAQQPALLGLDGTCMVYGMHRQQPLAAQSSIPLTSSRSML
jgi:hypothetical protein